MRTLTLSIFALVLSLHLMAHAEDEMTKDRPVGEIKAALGRTEDPEKRFHLMSALMRKYASDPLPQDSQNEAKGAAENLLKLSASFKTDWDYGNAVHHAHLVLGRVNLAQGKMNEAKTELKLAGQTPGSPQLKSYGPNMTLAKELLEKGEKTAVLSYFDDCTHFWTAEVAKPKIEKWKTEVAQGHTPAFTDNLVY